MSPHYRTLPDGIKSNNYSYPGNFNPNKREVTPIPGNDVWVNGYYRSDGTYVDGHWRRAPRSEKISNPDPLPPGVASRKPPIHNDTDVLRVQARLKELGYYHMKVDGIWGVGSKAALQSFKIDNQLPDNPVWDLETEKKLFSMNPHGDVVVQYSKQAPAISGSVSPSQSLANIGSTTQGGFSIGSEKELVLRLQGTPQSVNRYEALGEEVLSYGFSTVTISIPESRVIEWSDTDRTLKVCMLPSRPTNVTSFTMGSSSDDVLHLQGTPQTINKYRALGYEVWSYGFSTVTIGLNDKKVLEWNNIDAILKVNMLPGTSGTNIEYFSVGSHCDDVLRLQGTPNSITKYMALGYEVWSFGFSTVTIGVQDKRVMEWNNSDSNLRVK